MIRTSTSISIVLDLFNFFLQGQDVKVYSIHPGIVYTDLYVNVWWMKPLSLLAKYVTIYHVIPPP